ncbi:MAG TPA: HAD-IA family hydrolase [Candidatus Olsenella excrementigallinarum]|nr:HAD-IA family hydrolase [Candidatus Olsenella excrementigallinarum]
MPAYSTAIFDLDGTLLDSLEDLHLSTNVALAEHGLPARSLEEVRRFVGNGIRKLVERAVPAGTGAAEQEAVYEDFCAHYAAHCEDNTGPYPGILELLARLRAAGVRLAVVSNKGDFAVQELVARQFPGAFDAILGENEAAGIRKKPAPDMVEAALARMGADRDGMVYIGDSEVDVQTAASVGCPCISCTWGFRSVDDLLAAGATTFVNTPAELGRVLLGA